MPLDLRTLDSVFIEKLEKEKVIAVVPVGSIEQHCDSPLALDALIAERVAWLACQRLEERGKGYCIVFPTVYYGFSPEWARVLGTVSLSSGTFLSVIHDIAKSIARWKLKRIAIVNGHTNNSGLIKAALYEISLELDLKAAAIDYWRLCGIPLDHGGSVERAIAKALGIPVGSGNCREVSYSDGVLLSYVEGPSVIDFGKREINIDDLIEPIVSALSKLLEK
ncbi:MAG: creatininase family protein [Acidilobaceae archaeon]